MDDVERENANRLIEARTNQLRTAAGVIHNLKEALEDIKSRAEQALNELNKA